jgi:hypothetical protein
MRFFFFKEPATDATKIIALQGLLLGTDRCRKKALRSRLRQYLYLCTSISKARQVSTRETKAGACTVRAASIVGGAWGG